MTQAPPTLWVENGYAGWRAQALRALAEGWPPEAVTWAERSPTPQGGGDQMALDYAGPGIDADPGPNVAGAGPDADAAREVAGAGPDADAARDVPGPGPDAGPATCVPAPAADAGPAPEVAESVADRKAAPDLAGAAAPAQVRVSPALARLLQDAARYRSPRRWAFLYRVLWRWHHGDRAVASAADEDGQQLHAMSKSVRRAEHDMIAYLRFHRAGDAGATPEYLAWYEPEHDVLAYAAQHFARRMGKSTWLIGTPQGAALWDGHGLRMSDAPADADAIRAGAAHDQAAQLWLAYYQNIFNPARLNEAALQRQLPVRFWKHLPEGPLIPGMVAQARNGARRVAQAGGVGAMGGKPVAVDAQRAQPQRALPSSLDECRRCELWRQATQAVPGEGPATARVMLVGEQPGDQEDLAGRTFVGPAGQVLNDALRRAGVPRGELFLTNAVKHFKWFPRGQRRIHKTPAQREVEACAHWLDEELARVRPAVIVTLGATALGAILGGKPSLRDYLDAPVRHGDAWLVATWHPSYALRVDDPAAREKIVAGIAAAIERGWRLAGAP